MCSWQVQNAKARFTEFLNTALKKGPQIVTRRGVETAVLVPIEEWRRLEQSSRPSLRTLLLGWGPRSGFFDSRASHLQAAPPAGDQVARYLLDTDVISEVCKPGPDGGVLTWFRGLREKQLYISAVTIGELQRSIERIRVLDQPKALAIESWLDQLETTSNVLPMDASCFREWARLMESQADHLLKDAMIAATARVHSLTVATRNENDFGLLGVDLMNPFRHRSSEPNA